MLIQYGGGFLDLVYEPQLNYLPLDKVVSVRANSWDVLKTLDSVNTHPVHFNQHESVWPVTGFAPLHLIATELKLDGKGHLVDYLPIDHTPKAVAFSYRMIREFPYWSKTQRKTANSLGLSTQSKSLKCRLGQMWETQVSSVATCYHCFKNQMS